MWPGIPHSLDDLPAKITGALAPKMNIADIHQAAGIRPRGKTFFPYVKSSFKADFNPLSNHRYRGIAKNFAVQSRTTTSIPSTVKRVGTVYLGAQNGSPPRTS